MEIQILAVEAGVIQADPEERVTAAVEAVVMAALSHPIMRNDPVKVAEVLEEGEMMIHNLLRIMILTR